MNKVVDAIWRVVEVIIIIYVIIVTLFVLCKNKYGYTDAIGRVFINVNGVIKNNTKGTHNGDLLIVKKSNKLKRGDIVFYYSVYNDEYSIKSGVLRSTSKDNDDVLYNIDSTSIVSGRVIGNEFKTIPKVGGVLSTLETRQGFILLVLCPIIIVFIYQLYDFIVVLRNNNQNNKPKEDEEII